VSENADLELVTGRNKLDLERKSVLLLIMTFDYCSTYYLVYEELIWGEIVSNLCLSAETPLFILSTNYYAFHILCLHAVFLSIKLHTVSTIIALSMKMYYTVSNVNFTRAKVIIYSFFL
jgi:hypothetical protein